MTTRKRKVDRAERLATKLMRKALAFNYNLGTLGQMQQLVKEIAAALRKAGVK